jgi:hypothetical protein
VSAGTRAAHYCELALPLLRDTGQHRAHANAIHALANIRHQQGRLDDALDALDQALTISKTIGAHREQAAALITLGRVHRNAGRYDHATTALTTSLELTQNGSHPRLQSFAHTGLATVHIRHAAVPGSPPRRKVLPTPAGRWITPMVVYSTRSSMIRAANRYWPVTRVQATCRPRKWAGIKRSAKAEVAHP